MRLKNHKRVAVDTNIFIYHLTRESPFHLKAVNLFGTIIKKKINLITSNITIVEVLSFDAPENQIKLLEKEFLQIPNLKITEVNNSIAFEAAKIRRLYNFSLPDAIQLATALSAKAKVFITNDERLKKFKELKVILLTELN